ncbi:uncharacterized protein METZ01_LOCUS494283, partial [marine metagenome]
IVQAESEGVLPSLQASDVGVGPFRDKRAYGRSDETSRRDSPGLVRRPTAKGL